MNFKNLVFYIICATAYAFAYTLPNKGEAIPTTDVSVKFTKANVRRDTTPRLPDEQMNVSEPLTLASESEELRIRLNSSQEGYLFTANTEGRLEMITLVMDKWMEAFSIRKPVNMRILHFPNKGDGTVRFVNKLPFQVCNVQLPIAENRYGHYLIQFVQDGTECEVEYSFYLLSPESFTKVIYFKPDFHNCKLVKQNGQ